MGMRTITVKLHNPSRRKREIIEAAMRSYSLAFQYLLDRAYGEIEAIAANYAGPNGVYKGAHISKWIDSKLSKELNRFGIEPFKDSLKIDFGMTLAGYLNLRKVQAEVSFPVAYVSSEEYEQRYQELIDRAFNSNEPLDKIEKEMDRLSRKYESVKPLFFCRNAVNRDYCLLYDEVRNRYYVKMYLMNGKSSFKKAVVPRDSRKLIYIHKDKKDFVSGSRKERYILVPLEFGKWQEQYLQRALENPGLLKTARLIKKNKEYFLSINIDMEDAEKVETCSFLGLSRSFTAPLRYTVSDRDGNILEEGFIPFKNKFKEMKETVFVNEIYSLANTVIEIALRNRAHVIVESLTNKSDRLSWPDEYGNLCRPVLGFRSYNRLVSVLEYKLPGRGLPSPLKVSPTDIFYTCPLCGNRSKYNRFSKDIFICTVCGTTEDIERLGSRNLSHKLIKYENEAVQIKAEKTPKGIKLVNEDLGLEFTPSNPAEFLKEFREEINRIIEDFYGKIHIHPRNKAFKKKYGLIKRLEKEQDLQKVIEVIDI